MTKTSVSAASTNITSCQDCEPHGKITSSGRLAIERIAMASMKNSYVVLLRSPRPRLFLSALTVAEVRGGTRNACRYAVARATISRTTADFASA
jgi:hypothetical protein